MYCIIHIITVYCTLQTVRMTRFEMVGFINALYTTFAVHSVGTYSNTFLACVRIDGEEKNRARPSVITMRHRKAMTTAAPPLGVAENNKIK